MWTSGAHLEPIVQFSMRQTVKNGLARTLGMRQHLARQDAVLLTFDDGPEPTLTEQILARLKRYGARAVFFSVGYQVERAGHLLKAVWRDGHEIGNHSFAHPLDAPPTVSSAVEDLRRCQSVIEAQIGAPPKLFRPPFGAIRLRNVLAARALKLKTVLWSVDSHDWEITSARQADERGRLLAATVVPGDIVLLHEHNEHVLTVLDHLLPSLRARGIDVSRGVELL